MTKLTSEQDAIKQAVKEGGYGLHDVSFDHHDTPGDEPYGEVVIANAISDSTLTLQDPAFWQALGKARGWPEYSEIPGCFTADEEYAHDLSWRVNAVQWFETLLSGGDMQKFWESLP